jgi:hypothetical protein
MDIQPIKLTGRLVLCRLLYLIIHYLNWLYLLLYLLKVFRRLIWLWLGNNWLNVGYLARVGMFNYLFLGHILAWEVLADVGVLLDGDMLAGSRVGLETREVGQAWHIIK